MKVLLLLLFALHTAEAQECPDLRIADLNVVRNVDGTFSCYHPSQRLVEAVCTERQQTPAYCGANTAINVAEGIVKHFAATEVAFQRACQFSFGDGDCSEAVDGELSGRQYSNTCARSAPRLVPLAGVDLTQLTRIDAFNLSLAILSRGRIVIMLLTRTLYS